ncbi:glycosyltransferase [Candidatus Bathyarchaeota archaeon]|nr:glycosyltransferase [Candidatus Bathyarchaeota archaeon]
MKVSVIISSYTEKRLNDILKCISSLGRQTLPPIEIILVLNPVEELVRFYRSRLPTSIKIIVSPRFGLSHARNAGAQAASGSLIAFIDDDAFADEDWLKNVVQNFDDPDVMGVGGTARALWDEGRPRWFPEELDWIVGCSYKGFPEHRSLIRNPFGCNMCFRKLIFSKVGFFRTDIGRMGKILLANEETEFSMRILRKNPNWKIVYEPSAVVNHRVPRNRKTLKYVWKRSFFEGLSKALISSGSSLQNTLYTEGRYLRYLLGVAIPTRLWRPSLETLSQVLTLLVSMSGVFAGFMVEAIIHR